MPSANNPNIVKTERTGGPEQPDPLRQAITIIEHKIRNLEKRKAKLESYREISKSGKTLTREQADAVSKYDEVQQHLELSREYVKQFTQIGDTADKGKKRQAKRDVLERTSADTAKIKQVLIIQDVLQNMGGDQVREDFLAGSNGAPLLTELDLKSLDDLYVEIYPKHDSPTPFATQVQKASEHLMTIIEGKTREVAGVTGAKLLTLVTTISACGYFDPPDPAVAAPAQPDDVAADEFVPEAVAEVESVGPPSDNGVVEDAPALSAPQQVGLPVQPPLPNIPSAAPIHTLIQNIVPVSQVESNIFNAQGFQPPSNGVGVPPVGPVPTSAPPQPVSGVPLADPMSRLTTNLTFFQDSQIDTTELPAASITSRTFTNQNYNGQPVAGSMAYPPANTAYYVPGYGGGMQPDMGAMYPPAAAPPASALPDPARTFAHPQSQHVTSNGYSGVTSAAVTQSYQIPATAAAAPAPQPQPAPQPTLSPPKEEVAPEVGDWNGTESRLDWAADSIDEWNPAQPDEGKRTGGRGRGDRGGDRPRNYNRNNNRNNYNGRSGNRESGSYYSNNQNGYQARQDRDRGDQPRQDRDRGDYQPRQDRDRGDQPRQDRDRGDYQPRQDRDRGDNQPRQDRDRGDNQPRQDRDRGDQPRQDRDRGDYQPRQDRDRDYQPRAEKEFQPRDREQNGGYGGNGYRRGGATRPPRQDRPPRSDRQDRPYSNSGAGNNQGGRPPRNNARPSGYRQETADVK